MSSRPTVRLPVGKTIGWDTNIIGTEEEAGLKTVAESGVLARSLKQSRDKWLYHTFPKFITRHRGKVNADHPPILPHTILARGRCNLEIGPHIFPETTIYEVTYLPHLNVASTSTQPNSTTCAANSYLQCHVGSASSPMDISSPMNQPSAIPLFQNASQQIQYTNRFNARFASDPAFANLFVRVTNRQCTQEDAARLGQMLHELNTPGHLPMLPPVKEFDVVLEFRESPNDRWLIPRGPSLFEPPAGATNDGTLFLKVPFDQETPARDRPTDGELDEWNSDSYDEPPLKPGRRAKLIFKTIPPSVTDTFSRWVGSEEAQAESRALFDTMNRERLYLGYRLMPGQTLTDLKALAEPHPMRLLKHGPMPKPRSSRARGKRPASKADHNPTALFPDLGVGPSASAGGSMSPTRPHPGETTSKSPPAKRQKAETNPPRTHDFRCTICGQKDVPLYLGGKFCRACADSQRAGSHTVPSLTQSPVTKTSVGPLMSPTPTAATAAPTDSRLRPAASTVVGVSAPSSTSMALPTQVTAYSNSTDTGNNMTTAQGSALYHEPHTAPSVVFHIPFVPRDMTARLPPPYSAPLVPPPQSTQPMQRPENPSKPPPPQ